MWHKTKLSRTKSSSISTVVQARIHQLMANRSTTMYRSQSAYCGLAQKCPKRYSRNSELTWSLALCWMGLWCTVTASGGLVICIRAPFAGNSAGRLALLRIWAMALRSERTERTCGGLLWRLLAVWKVLATGWRASCSLTLVRLSLSLGFGTFRYLESLTNGSTVLGSSLAPNWCRKSARLLICPSCRYFSRISSFVSYLFLLQFSPSSARSNYR